MYLYQRLCYFTVVITVKKQLDNNFCNCQETVKILLTVTLDINQNIIHSLSSITPTHTYVCRIPINANVNMDQINNNPKTWTCTYTILAFK